MEIHLFLLEKHQHYIIKRKHFIIGIAKHFVPLCHVVTQIKWVTTMHYYIFDILIFYPIITGIRDFRISLFLISLEWASRTDNVIPSPTLGFPDKSITIDSSINLLRGSASILFSYIMKCF